MHKKWSDNCYYINDSRYLCRGQEYIILYLDTSFVYERLILCAMKKEIKFSLVYRDMWQSSGKYQPRVDQFVRIAPLIIEMGCFARVETNGGAFEQVNLLYGENPNVAVRAFT